MPQIVRQTTAKPVPKKTGTVLDRIKPLGFDGSRGISILLYGQSGTGKTTLWSTFPDPILSVICSGIASPGELLSVDTAANRKRIQTVTLENSTELEDLVEHQKDSNQFKTIVLDHVSGFQDLKVKEYLGLEETPLAKYRLAGKGESWGLMNEGQWGQVSLQVKEALRKMLNLIKVGCNVVIIGQERETKPKENATQDIGIPSIGVATIPSVAAWLNPTVDYICQTFKRAVMVEKVTKLDNGKEFKVTARGNGVEFCCRTGPHDLFTTKFRVPLGTPLPDDIVNPDYTKLMKLIKQGG